LRIAAASYGEATATIIQSVYLAVNGIILLALTPLGGVLADRWNKTKIMYITDYIRGITILLTGVFILLSDNLLWEIVSLFLMNVILSVNAGIFSPASSSLLRFIVSDEELQPGAALLQGSSSFQSIVGLVLFALLYSTVNIFVIFLINGLAYLISAFSEMFIRYDHVAPETRITMKVVIKDTKEGLSYLFHQKAIFVLLIMALFVNFFFNPIFAVGLPNFIEFGLETETGYLFSGLISPKVWLSVFELAFSIAVIIMSLILSRKATSENLGKKLKIALVSITLPVVVLALGLIGYHNDLFSVNTSLIVITLAMFALGFANVAFNVPVSLAMQKKVDRNMLGKVSSVSNVLSMGLVPISSLLGGMLIAEFSPSVLYGVCAVGTIIVTALYVKNKQANEI
jgi:MFS family permease